MSKQHERGILSDSDLKKPLNRVVYGLMVFGILVMIVTMLYPILMTMFNGLKTNQEVNTFPPHFFPETWNWSNFKEGWEYIDLPMFLKNTLFVFVGNLVMTIFVLGLASFSISRLKVPYHRAIYFFILMTLFIPASSYMIPNFVNLKDLGLLNTFWAFWLPAGASAYYFLLMKNFFDGIHPEIFEAARIDGASEINSYIRIASRCPCRFLRRWRSLFFRAPGTIGSGRPWCCTAKRNTPWRRRSTNTSSTRAAWTTASNSRSCSWSWCRRFSCSSCSSGSLCGASACRR
ncbi:Lactose transport system permease protein LacG [Paenibacillus sp. P1XP2]|nr:Lactose transport system permease protein LacG [Paenibacillus sp. P1XP2]